MSAPPAAAAAAWTPASLPGLAYWYEADAAHSFTDLGVTAVTTDGQQVEQVNDKSGLGHTLTQSNAAWRPTWFSNSGKPYWQFSDSVTNFLQSASGLTVVDASGQWWMAVTVSFDSLTAQQIPASIEGSPNRIAWLWASGGSARARSFNNANSATDDVGNALTAGTPVVLIGYATTAAVEVFNDNVSSGSTALTGTRANNTATLTLGESAGSGLPVGGKIFVWIGGTGTLSSSDRANLQAYMAALHP